MKEVYHQSFPTMLIIIAIASGIASYEFFSNYGDSNSLVHLLLANLFLLVAIVCLKPLVEWRRIEIDDECIIISKRFFSPIVINISDSLYQVVMHNEDIRSFRFRCGEYYTQVSPAIYQNGNSLSMKLKDHIRKHKLCIEVVE